MRLELTGRHVDITPGLRRLIDTKLTKLDRLLNDRAVSAQCVLKLERHRHCVELTLHARGETFMHAVGDADGWEGAVKNGVARLVHQAGKAKGKAQVRVRHDARTLAVPADPSAPEALKQPRIARERLKAPRMVQRIRRGIVSMSLAHATRALGSAGNDVVIFRDVETSLLSVLFRRPNGDLALVETEP
jgi:putative sigma-54 modulation protein